MPPRKRRPRVNRHFKIDDVLPAHDREDYLAFLREPPTTIDLAHAWLATKGYRDFSRSAVARHRRHYLESCERNEAALRQAQAFARLATSGGAPDFIAGAMLQAEHLMFEQVWDFKHHAEDQDVPVAPRQLQAFLEALSALFDARARLMKLQRRTAQPVKATDRGASDIP